MNGWVFLDPLLGLRVCINHVHTRVLGLAYSAVCNVLVGVGVC